jgi:hypothetical protein
MALVFIARKGMGRATPVLVRTGRCVALKKKPGRVGTGVEEHGNGSTFSE